MPSRFHQAHNLHPPGHANDFGDLQLPPLHLCSLQYCLIAKGLNSHPTTASGSVPPVILVLAGCWVSHAL